MRHRGIACAATQLRLCIADSAGGWE
jgi:hypothetical protein